MWAVFLYGLFTPGHVMSFLWSDSLIWLWFRLGHINVSSQNGYTSIPVPEWKWAHINESKRWALQLIHYQLIWRSIPPWCGLKRSDLKSVSKHFRGHLHLVFSWSDSYPFRETHEVTLYSPVLCVLMCYCLMTSWVNIACNKHIHTHTPHTTHTHTHTHTTHT